MANLGKSFASKKVLKHHPHLVSPVNQWKIELPRRSMGLRC